MAVADIGLRRLASQHVSTDRLDGAADVVRALGALQAQDYHQALWAIASRMRSGTIAAVEGAIAERRIVRTWLMRGTIHYAPPEDVRWLLALVAPRLAVSEERRRVQIGLAKANIARSRKLLAGALGGDNRLSRPEVMALLEANGIATAGGHGYHILWRLAQDGLICLGPTERRQQTVVLLDDWAPRDAARELSRDASLAALAERFATARGPVTAHDLARWAGITLADARQGLVGAEGLATEEIDGSEHWLAAEQAGAGLPAAGRRSSYLLAGFDEFMLGYKDRDAFLASEYADRVVPGANGVFRPVIVTGGRIVGTWSRTVKPVSLAIELHPFTEPAPKLVEQVRGDADRYRKFLGLPASCAPVVTCVAGGD